MTDSPAAAPADPWSMTTDQISSLTPDQATAALAAMDRAIHPPPSVVPADAQDARMQLDLLSRNASWAESLFKGNVETRKQFDELVAKAAGANDTEDMVAGIVEPAMPLFETTANGELPRRHVEGDREPERRRARRPQHRTSYQLATNQPQRIYGRAGAPSKTAWHGRVARQIAQRRGGVTVKYVCDFVHPKTRERRTIVVELDSDEVADARRNLGIDGPVAKLYTMQKASRCVPAGFDPDLASITRVQLH
jgi:hypothetical protein